MKNKNGEILAKTPVNSTNKGKKQSKCYIISEVYSFLKSEISVLSCGKNSDARTIGPATSPGKNAMNNT